MTRLRDLKSDIPNIYFNVSQAPNVISLKTKQIGEEHERRQTFKTHTKHSVLWCCCCHAKLNTFQSF